MPFWLKILALAFFWPIAGVLALIAWPRYDEPDPVFYGWLAVGFMLLVLISIHHARRPDRWDQLRPASRSKKRVDSEAGAPS